MVLPVDGTPHDCFQETDLFMWARDDLYNQPITVALNLFVDGHAGYAIVELNKDNTFTDVQATKIAQPCSSQLAEMKALKATCKLA